MNDDFAKRFKNVRPQTKPIGFGEYFSNVTSGVSKTVKKMGNFFSSSEAKADDTSYPNMQKLKRR
jgi:hypothetical protein